jgi:DNA-binding NtrC family response regulator
MRPSMKDRMQVRTLVIDDDDSVCRRLNDWLGAEAYEVFAFTDPHAALRHAAGRPIELALVDLRLPETDGSQIIAELCRSSPRTRVVAMSAFPEKEQVLRAMQAGACELLPKPIQRPLLLETLGRQLAEIGISAHTEDAFNRRLGARLREIRVAANRTQQDVAERADITAAQLSQIERGKTGTSTWTLARVCGALEINLCSLFHGM